jgi:hypothetical protein
MCIKPIPMPDLFFIHPVKETVMSVTHFKPLRRTFALAALTLPLVFAPVARAHNASEDLSLLSALPVAVSVAAPVGVLSAGAAFTVVAVQATAIGAVWVLERASDGARVSIELSAQGAKALSVGVGMAVNAVALSTGLALVVASEVICFIPDELGKALLYNERLTP